MCKVNACSCGDGQPCIGSICHYSVDGGRYVELMFHDYCDRAAEKVRNRGWKLKKLADFSMAEVSIQREENNV